MFFGNVSGIVGRHVGQKYSTRKVLQARLCWAPFFKDTKDYAKNCDVFQRVGEPSHNDELPLHPVWALKAFQMCVVVFIGPINPCMKFTSSFNTIDYLKHWAKAIIVQDCTTSASARFIFQNTLTIFYCPSFLKVIMDVILSMGLLSPWHKNLWSSTRNILHIIYTLMEKLKILIRY